MKWIHALIAKLRGKNSLSTPKDVIKDQLLEPRPLPMGRKEFEDWSDRIISGALIPGATAQSLKFALAEMVMHAKPTESHIADGYFIQCLRKAASNQICWAVITEFKDEQRKKILEAQSKAAEVKPEEAKPETKFEKVEGASAT